MKTILTFILALISTVAFAGDLIFAPIIKAPAPGDMDIYVITNDRGRSEVVTVFSLENLGDDAYAIVDTNGKSTIIMKLGD